MAEPGFPVIGLACILFLILTINLAIRFVYTKKAKQYLNDNFTLIPELNTFTEARPRACGGPVKLKHAVLLLHGYSASPEEFKFLYGALQTAGIPYYAPLITGFGINGFHLLYHVKPSDWLRDAINGYDLLAAFAEEISILGHSNGGALAAYVAQNRPVKHLVLIGPNLMVQPSDEFFKKLLGIPLLAYCLEQVVPIFKKPVRSGRVTNVDTCNPKAALRTFHYPTLPMRSLKVLWSIQGMIDIARASFQTLTLMYGEDDRSVDIGSLINYLEKRMIFYNKLSFKNSGHNVLEDYDSKTAVKAIMRVLTGGNEF